MKHILVGKTLIATLLIASSQSLALPRFALMTGTKCGSCHVNPTGGQMRNDFGTAYSAEKLPLEALKDTEFTFSGKLNDNISIGGDYRSQLIYDSYGADSQAIGFQAMTASLYGTVKLTAKIQFFFRYDMINSIYNNYGGQEIFGIAKILPGAWYIKGGDFLPNYGWRVDDHTIYTRGGNIVGYAGFKSGQGLFFLPNYKDVGLEIAGYIAGINISGGVFNGSGNSRPIDLSNTKAFVSHVDYMGSVSSLNYLIGGSVYNYGNRSMGGLNAGFAVGDIVVLGEVDWAKNLPALAGAQSFAGLGEIDFRPMQGIWMTGRYEVFDPTDTVRGDAYKRIVLGMEIFPYSFVELRPQYRINLEKAAINNDQVVVQMHLWF